MSITVLALNAVFTVYIVFLMYIVTKVGGRTKWGLIALIYAIAVIWVSIMIAGESTSDTCSRMLHYSTSKL